MCIRDSVRAFAEALDALEERIDALDKIALLDQRRADLSAWASASKRTKRLDTCLLYTSDAADERSSVDLGGRRIIKKNTKKKNTKKREQKNI